MRHAALETRNRQMQLINKKEEQNKNQVLHAEDRITTVPIRESTVSYDSEEVFINRTSIFRPASSKVVVNPIELTRLRQYKSLIENSSSTVGSHHTCQSNEYESTMQASSLTLPTLEDYSLSADNDSTTTTQEKIDYLKKLLAREGQQQYNRISTKPGKSRADVNKHKTSKRKNNSETKKKPKLLSNKFKSTYKDCYERKSKEDMSTPDESILSDEIPMPSPRLIRKYTKLIKDSESESSAGESILSDETSQDQRIVSLTKNKRCSNNYTSKTSQQQQESINEAANSTDESTCTLSDERA